MKRTFASIVLLVLVSMASLAQSGSATPAAPATSPTPTIPTGNKVATISMQDAIAASNEGQRDFEALAKKFEPRRLELQKQNSDIEDQKKQLTKSGRQDES
jgi:outer membrane protein